MLSRAVFSHKIVVFSEMKTAPFQNRTFLNACVCQRLANGVWVLAAVPLASHARLAPAEERHALRAEAMRCFRCTPAEGARRAPCARASMPAFVCAVRVCFRERSLVRPFRLSRRWRDAA